MRLYLILCLFISTKSWTAASPAMFMSDGQPDRRNLSKALILEDEDDEDNEVGGDHLARQIKDLGSLIFGEPDHGTGKRLEGWSEDSLMNAEEIGGYVEGDILFRSDQGPARNGLNGQNYRWPNGEIPYEINYLFSPRDSQTIMSAFNDYHKHTCLRFRPRTRADRDYIYINNGHTGCWSSVGRIGGRQEVNLQSPGCLSKKGTVIHELMHAVGFLHEQNREDRDSYVRINWENVQPERSVNFKKADRSTTDSQGEPYDYKSVMHYSARAFSRNNRDTISPLRGSYELGQREGFSQTDINKIRKMYKC